MKFSITAKHEVDWPVTCSVPLDGGKHGVLKFHATFEILPQEEVDALEAPDVAKFDQVLLDRVLVGWRDLPDADDGTVEFTPENKAAALRWPFIRAGLIEAYRAAVQGRKAKN